MICFEVSVNGERFCCAGIGQFGTMSAMINWGRRGGEPPKAANDRTEEWSTEELSVHVGGFYREPPDGDGEYLRWGEQQLKPGDVVAIKVVESETWDEPVNKEPYVAHEESEREREYYLRLKKKYEPNGSD